MVCPVAGVPWAALPQRVSQHKAHEPVLCYLCSLFPKVTCNSQARVLPPGLLSLGIDPGTPASSNCPRTAARFGVLLPRWPLLPLALLRGPPNTAFTWYVTRLLSGFTLTCFSASPTPELTWKMGILLPRLQSQLLALYSDTSGAFLFRCLSLHSTCQTPTYFPTRYHPCDPDPRVPPQAWPAGV